MANEECLQDKTGSCAGCNVAEIVRRKSIDAGQRRPAQEIVQRVQESLCPEGAKIQTRVLREPKQSIW